MTPSPDRSESFPKSRRLLQRARFQRVYNEGIRVFGPLFSVFLLASGEPEPGRVGLTVSKKVGKAVVRTRAKRLLREASRHNWELFPDGAWVVLHARREIRDVGVADVEAELKRCLRKAADRIRARPS